jgi:hypothetical protein
MNKMFLGIGAFICFSGITSLAQSSTAFSRANSWEFYIGPMFVNNKTLEFDGGASAEIEDRVAFYFGGGYNFNDHIAMELMLTSSSGNYTGTTVNDAGQSQKFVADMYSSIFNVALTYYVLPGRFTPFVSGNMGFNYIDSGVPTGEISEGCWWDPWYGYDCYSYARTYNSTKFNYGIQAGLRYDFPNHLFVRGSVGTSITDLDSRNTAAFTVGSLVMGFSFQ